MFPILVLKFLMFLGLIPFHFSSECTCVWGGCTAWDVCMYVWYALCVHVCVGSLAGMYVCMCVCYAFVCRCGGSTGWDVCVCVCVMHVCVHVGGPLAGMYVCMCYICVCTRGGALGCVCDMHMCAHVCVGALAGMYVCVMHVCAHVCGSTDWDVYVMHVRGHWDVCVCGMHMCAHV